jgi:hypothetical protein
VFCPGSLCSVEQAPGLHLFSSSGVCSRLLVLDLCTRPFARADRRDRVSLSESRLSSYPAHCQFCCPASSCQSVESPLLARRLPHAACSRSVPSGSFQAVLFLPHELCQQFQPFIDFIFLIVCDILYVYPVVFLSRQFKSLKFYLIALSRTRPKVFDEISVRPRVAL